MTPQTHIIVTDTVAGQVGTGFVRTICKEVMPASQAVRWTEFKALQYKDDYAPDENPPILCRVCTAELDELEGKDFEPVTFLSELQDKAPPSEIPALLVGWCYAIRRMEMQMELPDTFTELQLGYAQRYLSECRSRVSNVGVTDAERDEARELAAQLLDVDLDVVVDTIVDVYVKPRDE